MSGSSRKRRNVVKDLKEPTTSNIDMVAVNPGMYWFAVEEANLPRVRSMLYEAVKRASMFNISTHYDRKNRNLRVTISDE